MVLTAEVAYILLGFVIQPSLLVFACIGMIVFRFSCILWCVPAQTLT